MAASKETAAAATIDGPRVEEGPSTMNLHSYIFSSPFRSWPNNYRVPFTQPNPRHSFQGSAVAPHRPLLVDAASGATLSWQRVRHDSLRVARSLASLVGAPSAFDASLDAIHQPRTTVLLHLPNCLAFPVLFLGAVAAQCTVSPVSTMLTPAELAKMLAKARPQVLVTSAGPAGEGVLRAALQMLLEEALKKDVCGQADPREVLAWARELASSWDAGARLKVQRAETQAWRERRVWTVNVQASTDYYGTNARGTDKVAAQVDPRDWTHLLFAPPGHWHASSVDELTRPAFNVAEMKGQGEQGKRVALMLWSSGTTGTSKAVLLSHEALIHNLGSLWASQTSLNADGEVWVTLAPWCHVFGLATLLLLGITIGATLVVPSPSRRFDLETYLGLVTRYGATLMHIAPPIAIALLHTPLLDDYAARRKSGQVKASSSNAAAAAIVPTPSKMDLSTVRALFSGGAPTPPQVIRGLYERLGLPLHLGYGTTETASVSQTLGASYASDSAALQEIGSVGALCGGVQVSIQQEEGAAEGYDARLAEFRRQCDEKRSKGIEAPSGARTLPGQVRVRSHNNMLGYYSGLASSAAASCIDAGLTREAFSDDDGLWYLTGDEGVVDRHGSLWITGRIKELIKVRGFQVAPAELDDVVSQRPDVVADVATTGEEEAGGHGEERIVVYLTLKASNTATATATGRERKDEAATVEALHEWLKQRLARYKWPAAYVVVDTIPKSPSGKVVRRKLKEAIDAQGPGSSARRFEPAAAAATTTTKRDSKM